MIERPDAVALLSAMARALTDDVIPVTDGTAQHTVRVVANLCRILERELDAPPSTALDAPADLVDGDPNDRAALAELLDTRLRADDPEFDRAARRALLADVVERLEIARPGYVEE